MEAILHDGAITVEKRPVAPSNNRELLAYRPLGQALDAYVAEEDCASGIVSLKGEGAFA
jgi:hypothetical protein